MGGDAPPPPPPHGDNPKSSGLPPGNYDIFIIPPHSAGSGFFYLPSLQPHRNSFLAGVACTLAAVGLWNIIVPALQNWLLTITTSGGAGLIMLVAMAGVAGWAFGKTQEESSGDRGPGPGGGASAGNGTHTHTPGGPPPYTAPPPQPGPKPQQSAKPSASGAAWDKAREETRKREEERKRTEDLRKKREEAEKAAKAAAEKTRWEQQRAREKEAREREARERIAKERREKEAKDREKESEGSSTPKAAQSPAGARKYERPTARSYVSGDNNDYAYRTRTNLGSSQGSESSYAPSVSTARTTPPPMHRGPYSTRDPEKIMIKGVFMFKDTIPMKPARYMLSGEGNVTDGLILTINTEGLFINDDLRGVGHREWDVKAWALKLTESGKLDGVTVFRATVRDTLEGKTYVFVIPEHQAFKLDLGLSRLKKGNLVRSMHHNGLKANEVKIILTSCGLL